MIHLVRLVHLIHFAQSNIEAGPPDSHRTNNPGEVQ
jgi:hypothetical protein